MSISLKTHLILVCWMWGWGGWKNLFGIHCSISPSDNYTKAKAYSRNMDWRII